MSRALVRAYMYVSFKICPLLNQILTPSLAFHLLPNNTHARAHTHTHVYVSFISFNFGPRMKLPPKKIFYVHKCASHIYVI